MPVVGRQQSPGRILDDLARERIDGLQQPGQRVGRQLDAGADAQYVALAPGEVEIVLERADAAGNVDLDVADLEVTETERARVVVGVELRDDANLADRRRGLRCVLELDRVGLGDARRHELVRAVAERPVQEGLAATAAAVEERGEVRRLDVDEVLVLGMGLVVGVPCEGKIPAVGPGNVDVVRFIVRRRRGVEIEVARRRRIETDIGRRLVRTDRILLDGLIRCRLGRIVAVPLLDLAEELQQIATGDDLLAGRAGQDASRQGRLQTDENRIVVNLRRLVDGPQQARLGQRGQVQFNPGHGIGGQILQRRRRRRVLQDVRAQGFGRLPLLRDIFVGRQRRRRAHDVEREGSDAWVLALIARRQPVRIGLHQKAERGVGARGEIVGEAGGQRLTVGIGDRDDAGPRHIGNAWRARDVGGDAEIRHPLVQRRTGYAVLELNVGNVDIGLARQREAIEAALAGPDDARTAERDAHVGRQRLFDQIAIRCDGDQTVRIDHLDVVEPVRRIAQIEDRNDPGWIHDLVADRLVLREARPHQLDDRLRIELGAGDHRGDIAAVAALVLHDVGDAERQHMCKQGYARIRSGLRLAMHKHVVCACRGRRNDGDLVGLDGTLIGGVVGRTGRQRAVAQEQRVGGGRIRGGEVDLQALALCHRDLEQPVLAGAERRVDRDAEMQLRHGHLQGARRRRRIVLRRRFDDVVEDVGPHDDPVGPGRRRRQTRIQRPGIGPARQDGPVDVVEPDRPVVDVPGVVAGEIGHIAPRADGRVDTDILDRPGQMDGIARHRAVGDGDGVDDKIGRRRLVDQQRRSGRGRVVALLVRLEHHARQRRCRRRRVGQHEHVPRAGQILRRLEAQAVLVAGAGREPAGVRDGPEIDVGVAEEPVARQVDVIVPFALAVRRRTGPGVRHLVSDGEGLPRQHVAGLGRIGPQRLQRRDLQVRRRHQRHRHEARGDVVALALELRDAAHPVVVHQARNVQHAGSGTVGVDQDVIVAADAIGKLSIDGGRIARSGRQDAAMRHRADLGVAAVERGIQREEQPVGPAPLPRVAVAEVGDREGDRDDFARVRRLARQDEIGDLQVGLAVDDGNDARRAIVADVLVAVGRKEITSPGIVPRMSARIAVRVGDHIDVIRLRIRRCAANPLGKNERCRLRVARTARKRLCIAVLIVSDESGLESIERRVTREVDVIRPVARTGPGIRPEILHRPADRRGFAGVVRCRCADGGDAKIGDGSGRDAGISDVDVVAGILAFPRRRDVVAARGVPAGVGDDDDILARNLGRELEGRLAGIGAVGVYDPVVLHGAEEPLVADVLAAIRRHEIGDIRQIDLVEQNGVLGRVGTLVLHRPSHRIVFAADARRLWRDRGHDQVGRRRQQHGDRTCLVIVVVGTIRIVGVDVDVLGALVHHVERVRPGRDEELAGDVLGQGHGRGDVVARWQGDHAGIVADDPIVRDGGEQHVALRRVRPRSVARQPDLVRPVFLVSRLEAEIVDVIGYRDRRAIEGLDGRLDVAGDEVRRRLRVDRDLLDEGVVVAVGKLADSVIGVGVNDDIGGAAEPLRNQHVAGRYLVFFAGSQCGEIVKGPDQDRAAVEVIDQRNVDIVLPVTLGLDDALVDDREIERNRAASVRRRRQIVDREDLQIRIRGNDQREGIGIRERVVARSRLVDWKQTRIGLDHQLEYAGHVARQLNDLGPAVGQSGSERAREIERAQAEAAMLAADLLQEDAVNPGPVSAPATGILDRPADVDPVAGIGLADLGGGSRGRRDDGPGHEIGRRRQVDGHGSRDHRVVVGVDELRRAARLHHDIERAVQAVRDRRGPGPRVAAADFERADVIEAADKRDDVLAERIRRQRNAVGPGGAIGGTDCMRRLVGDGPRYRNGPAAVRRWRDDEIRDGEICKGRGDDIEHVRCFRGVVGFDAVFEHDVGRVGPYEQM